MTGLQAGFEPSERKPSARTRVRGEGWLAAAAAQSDSDKNRKIPYDLPLNRGGNSRVPEPAPTAVEAEDLGSLLAGAAEGDRAAFAELYQLTGRRLFPIALRLLRQREAAEEALQEAYLTIWRRAGHYSPDRGKPIAWMATIVRNQAIDRLRREKTRGRGTVEWDEAAEAEIAGKSLESDLPYDVSATVRHCVEGLQENYRKVILLAYYQGLTQEELAARLDAPLGTVKSWVRRGLSQLKDCVEQ